jgi:hypothetical protein
LQKSMKNPLLAGLLNMLVPGSVHIYISQERRRFFLTFIGVELVLAIVVWFGTSLQSSRSSTLPQGLCPGALALMVLIPLFLNGLKAATEHNKILDYEILYQSRRPASRGNDGEQLKKIQEMRDEGLISEQQYNTRKSQVITKKSRPSP